MGQSALSFLVKWKNKNKKRTLHLEPLHHCFFLLALCVFFFVLLYQAAALHTEYRYSGHISDV